MLASGGLADPGFTPPPTPLPSCSFPELSAKALKQEGGVKGHCL